MPRRIKPKKEVRDWRWYASFALNAAVALSMVLGTIFLFGGVSTPAPASVPTISVPTEVPSSGAPAVAPTATPVTQPAATPTPQASAGPASPVASAALNFAVVGDSRDGDAVFKEVLKDVSKDGSEFLIHLGDIVPRGTKDDWDNFTNLMQGFPLPFYPLPGNHEISVGKMTDYIKYSGATKNFYSFDRGTVHFTLLDSSVGSLLDPEYDWMDNDLANAQQPVKMVFVHHPPFDPANGNHVMYGDVDRFMQIVAARGVKYVFAGHIHCYEQAERDGVQYIITGGGGAPLSCTPDSGGYYHYVDVHVQNDTVSTNIVRVAAQ